MKKIYLIGILLSGILPAYAQNILNILVRDASENKPLPGATLKIKSLNLSAVSDSIGHITINNIPDGAFNIRVSFVGYNTEERLLTFPAAGSTPIEILLQQSEEEEMEEVVVTATRSSRTIANLPTRVETISGEELDEKGNMKPGDIRMLLNESTGIQTQQTSATSYNASIRIQGLDGKYTQILRDGLPLYAGFSGGLGLLQIAPLDLRQVEVIKGSSSTLFGGGAIAGLVNLVSKAPQKDRTLQFMANGTTAAGLDLSGFYAKRNEKTGTTLFASYNKGTAYDPANIGLTAIPKFDRLTLNPKLYLYLSPKTSLNIGVNATIEKRLGGDIEFIKGEKDRSDAYFEENKTDRYSTQFSLEHAIDENAKLTIKNSVSYYNRSIQIPDYIFSGDQLSSYTEANYTLKKKNTEWIGGINFITDRFNQNKSDSIGPVNYNQNTLGLFVQNTWNAAEKITLETGLRGDYQNDYGFFLLPRIAALFNISENFTSRIGGGLGYKTPTVFTEDAERIQFKNVLPIDINNTKAEKSYGGNIDFQYKTTLFNDQVAISINQLYFYTRINNPIILTPNTNGFFEFRQPAGYLDTKGIETNLKISYQNFKLFVGHTLADVKQHYTNTTELPLVARHRLNNVLMYEIEEKLKIGLEAYYFSSQKLNDGTTGKPYWLNGLMVEKLWENYSVFINFENFGDTRQTRFDTIYSGPINNPSFRDIYAPVDGFVVNGGFKISL